MSKQTSFLFKEKEGAGEIRLKGYVTKVGSFTIGTKTGASDIHFPFELGFEYTEIAMRDWADDNGYSLSETDADTKETILTEFDKPTVFSTAVNGADKMDLAWTDNTGGEAKYKVERRIKVAEQATLTCASGANVDQGDYAIFRNQAREEFLFWIDIDADGTEPTSVDYVRIKRFGGAIKVSVVNGDTADQLSVKVNAAIAAAFGAGDMTVTLSAPDIEVLQDISGLVLDSEVHAADGTDIDGASLSLAKDTEGADTGEFAEIDETAAGDEVYQDTGLDGGKEHFYRVRAALDSDVSKGDSAYSDVDSDSTP